ncbi:hypothetical protein LSAT2_015835, partial [Lamellibrachia satsuma]
MTNQGQRSMIWEKGNATMDAWNVPMGEWDADNGSELFEGNASVPLFQTPFSSPHIRWTFIILYTLVSAGCVIGKYPSSVS